MDFPLWWHECIMLSPELRPVRVLVPERFVSRFLKLAPSAALLHSPPAVIRMYLVDLTLPS